MAAKRLAVPKIPEAADQSSSEEIETPAQKKRKQNQSMAAARKMQYNAILQKNQEDARIKTPAIRIRDSRQPPQKKIRQISSTESSDSEDSLCAKSELRQVIQQKEYWKKKSKELEEENLFLRGQVSSLQRCLESKIFKLEERQEHAGERRAGAMDTIKGQLELVNAACSLQPAACPSTPPHVPAEQLLASSTGRPDFSYLEDGSFHLQKGITISAAVASKLLLNKKPRLVCKDIAQAIWGADVLAMRSVTGVVAPAKKASGEEPKQPLTPEKVDLVQAMLKHWGQQQGVDVGPVTKNLNRILAEKIQDVMKSKFRKSSPAVN